VLTDPFKCSGRAWSGNPLCRIVLNEFRSEAGGEGGVEVEWERRTFYRTGVVIDNLRKGTGLRMCEDGERDPFGTSLYAPSFLRYRS